jgi:hypothetical protein
MNQSIDRPIDRSIDFPCVHASDIRTPPKTPDTEIDWVAYMQEVCVCGFERCLICICDVHVGTRWIGPMLSVYALCLTELLESKPFTHTHTHTHISPKRIVRWQAFWRMARPITSTSRVCVYTCVRASIPLLLPVCVYTCVCACVRRLPPLPSCPLYTYLPITHMDERQGRRRGPCVYCVCVCVDPYRQISYHMHTYPPPKT